jgi:hypothetical protein
MTLSTLAWPSSYSKWHQSFDYHGCQPLNKKLSHCPNKIKVFSPKFIIWLAKFSQFEECLRKHETQIYKIMKTNARYKSPIRSIKIRFKQTYVNLNFIRSLKCQTHYINTCFSVYTYRYFWLLGSRHNYWPYLITAQKGWENPSSMSHPQFLLICTLLYHLTNEAPSDCINL